MRRKVVLRAAGLILLTGGLLVVGLGLRSPGGPPQPPVWAATPRPVDHHGPALPRSVPVEVTVPSIGVRAPLVELGRARDGEVKAPPADRPDEAGWYAGGPSPGEDGAAVILGRVDSGDWGAVFYDLGRVRPGHRVEVERADGRVAVFTVESVERVAEGRFPTRRVYGELDHPGLRLVACDGPFDRAKRGPREGIVVYASQTATRSVHDSA